jgi:hypothetical protein
VTVPDDAPIMGTLIVYRIQTEPGESARVAVFRAHDPRRRILLYEDVTVHDNGREGKDWRGHPPFYSGGRLVDEATLAEGRPHLSERDNIRHVIAKRWGHPLSEHTVPNWDNVDVPLFHPEDWEDRGV